MINSRPLYPSSEDVWEEPPITPNDILIGRHSCPPQPAQEARVNPRHLLISVQNRFAEFWTCWLKYFASSLLPRNKWFRKRENVKIGDLVLELNPHRKRLQWEMAQIVDTFPRGGQISQEGAHQDPEWRVRSPHTQIMRYCYKA